MSAYVYNPELSAEDNAAAETAFIAAAAQAALLPEAVVLTRKEKLEAQIELLTKRIAADTIKLSESTVLLESIDKLEGITNGSVVQARIGRAETSKIVLGTITGVKVTESGARQFKLFHGEGFDADTVVINESNIVSVQ